MKKLVFGIIIGAMLATGIVYAVEYAIEPNPYQMTVDGHSVWMEGYNINGYSYFKLRDIGDRLGFGVDFMEDTIVIDSNKAEPTAAPTPSGQFEPVYAIDGIEARVYDGYDGYFIFQGDIENKYYGDYTFKLKQPDNTYYIGWRDKVFFDNYPQGGPYNGGVELEWYNTVLQPWLASEGWRM